MKVKSYRVQLRPAGFPVKDQPVNGQLVAHFPGGPPVGVIQEYDETTGRGVVVLNQPVHYTELENMGVTWGDFVDYEE